MSPAYARDDNAQRGGGFTKLNRALNFGGSFDPEILRVSQQLLYFIIRQDGEIRRLQILPAILRCRCGKSEATRSYASSHCKADWPTSDFHSPGNAALNVLHP